jgi:GNAT superfamily N-acetyltransferase
MQIAVRPAIPADANPLARINVRSWQHAYAGAMPVAYLAAMDVQRYQAIWSARIADRTSGASILVAEGPTDVAGYIVVGPARAQQDRPEDDVDGTGEVFAIYVDPPYLGTGVGRVLHDAGIGLLADDGFREAIVWVLAANRASLHWYARQGWTADGATSQWTGAGEPLLEVRLRRRVGLPAGRDNVTWTRFGPTGYGAVW